jgi:hypothetical protein
VWDTWDIAVKGSDQLVLGQLNALSKRMYDRSLRILLLGLQSQHTLGVELWEEAKETRAHGAPCQ